MPGKNFKSVYPTINARAAQVGATVMLDYQTLTTDALRQAVSEVRQQSYRAGVRRINASFEAAGGYSKAVEAIFRLLGKK